MPNSPHLIVEREGHIVTLTMNRPEVRNALGAEMLVRLADAWTEIDEDDGVRVAILTGAGGHFSSGADLKEMAGGRRDDEWAARFKQDPELHWRAFLRSYRLKKPLIAAVEGTANDLPLPRTAEVQLSPAYLEMKKSIWETVQAEVMKGLEGAG